MFENAEKRVTRSAQFEPLLVGNSMVLGFRKWRGESFADSCRSQHMNPFSKQC